MIREAMEKDLEQINQLMDFVSFIHVTPQQLKDIALVSVDEDQVVGFIWASVGESKHLAFVDYLAVYPEAAGAGFRLCREILRRFKAVGVKKIITHVKDRPDDKNALKSYKINVKIGLTPLKDRFVVFLGDTERMSALWDQHQPQV